MAEETIYQKESTSGCVGREWEWDVVALGREWSEGQCPGAERQGFSYAATRFRLQLLGQVEYTGRGLTSACTLPQ